MRYDVLLMDADMTIYDFHAAEKEALQKRRSRLKTKIEKQSGRKIHHGLF